MSDRTDLVQMPVDQVRYADLVLKACEVLAHETFKVPSEGIATARRFLAAALADHERSRGRAGAEGEVAR